MAETEKENVHGGQQTQRKCDSQVSLWTEELDLERRVQFYKTRLIHTRMTSPRR